MSTTAVIAPTSSDEARRRLLHVKQHLLMSKVTPALDHIVAKTGSRSGCLLSLESHALASAVEAWFEKGDLSATKSWAYNCGRLHLIWTMENMETHSPAARVLNLLMPLVSDHSLLIERYAHLDQAFDPKRRDSTTTLDFLSYQSLLALRGDWLNLIYRCEEVLAHPPRTASLNKYLLDQHFYLALAKSDKSSMEGVLHELVSTKCLRGRQNDESGFTRDLISTYAVIYAKLAQRHGHKISINSPLVPDPWIPIAPLASYTDSYPFMEAIPV